MIDIKVVRKYNSDCQEAQNISNQSLAKIDLLDKQIASYFKELSSLLGKDVNESNFEAVYQEVSVEVESLVNNGNDLLRRVQEEKQAGENVAGANTNYNVQNTPVNTQTQQAGNSPIMNSAPNQGVMAGAQGMPNNNWGQPVGNMPQMANNGQGMNGQQGQNANNQQGMGGQHNPVNNQGYGAQNQPNYGQQNFAGGPFGTPQSGLMPNNSVPAPVNNGYNAPNRGQAQGSIPMSEFNPGDIIGKPVEGM